jgi:hypothetical protein
MLTKVIEMEARNRKEVSSSRKEITGVFIGIPSGGSDNLDLKPFPCKSSNDSLVLTSEMRRGIRLGYRPMVLVAVETTCKAKLLELYLWEGLNPALVDKVKKTSSETVNAFLLKSPTAASRETHHLLRLLELERRRT